MNLIELIKEDSKYKVIKLSDEIITTVTVDKYNPIEKTSDRDINNIMVNLYCLYNNYKKYEQSEIKCWLCNFDGMRRGILKYKTIFGTDIFLHEYCYEGCTRLRQTYNIKTLSDTHYMLNIFNNRTIVYNNKELFHILHDNHGYIKFNENIDYEHVLYPYKGDLLNIFKPLYLNITKNDFIKEHVLMFFLIKKLKLEEEHINKYIFSIYFSVI